MPDKDKTNPEPAPFDFSKFPEDTLFYERRDSADRRSRRPDTGAAVVPVAAASDPHRPAPERRAKKERRRRIDPTTFEKQYTDDELEFMNAMQRFKVQAGKSFPTHGEVLRVAFSLGYRKVVTAPDSFDDDATQDVDLPDDRDEP